jgi:4-amino-4-deoxy-L-arabinose transferase-like glycosyltransferase
MEITLHRRTVYWLLLLLACATLYLAGLGNPLAPTNGDEMVYVHIARMTAESGHWLPLQSEILDTRNTKPPLLFWQAMVAGDWGQNWSLFTLRLPSVIYTFLTCLLLMGCTLRWRGNWRTALLAGALYLLFFSTFRYGRVYLTSAPETFWLSLPLFWLLWNQLRKPCDDSIKPVPWYLWTVFGFCIGLGCAYKSFALAAPAGAALWSAALLRNRRLSWKTVVQTTLGATWSTAIAVGIFALWFVLDPDPASVWQEFVVAENAGKMSNYQGYWHAALWGAYPMWTQLLAFAENSGLLFFIGLGLCLLAARWSFQRKNYLHLETHHWILIAWLIVWLIIFTIPSQRSARYVIPVMPAFAIAMALLWERIPLLWFRITLVIFLPILVLLGRIAWVMADMGMGSTPHLITTLVVTAVGMGTIIVGLYLPAWCRNASLVACASIYATFGLMISPLGSQNTSYSNEAKTLLHGARIAVPNGFTGQYERYHFVLPPSQITPYDAEGRNTGALHPEMPAANRLTYLLAQFDAVVWLQNGLQETTPSCIPYCKVLETRWHIKSRHKSGEITLDNLWYPEQWLFRKEWLVVNASEPHKASPPRHAP